MDRNNMMEVYNELYYSVRDFSECITPIFKANNWTWDDHTPGSYHIECMLKDLLGTLLTRLETTKHTICMLKDLLGTLLTRLETTKHTICIILNIMLYLVHRSR